MRTLQVTMILFVLSLAANAQVSGGGRRPVPVPPSGPSPSGSSESVSVPPDVQGAEALPFVALAVRDQANAGQSIMASTEPVLGMLYPLSNHLFVAPDGAVGMGTTNPDAGVLLHVEGKALFGNGNESTGAYSTVSGGFGNDASALAATISGGRQNIASGGRAVVGGGSDNIANGTSSVIAGGDLNATTADFASVGGGYENVAGAVAVVAGGDQNEATGLRSAIGGGSGNDAYGILSTIGGGELNVASGNRSTVGGGEDNEATHPHATVGGGWSNVATALGATVGGGSNNDVGGYHSVVSGGQGNGAPGHNAVVPGGFQNDAAGNYSFAAGREAQAAHAGTFVWSDSNGDAILDTPFASTAMDQFLIDAAGGVGIGTASPLARLHVEGDTGEDVMRVRIAGQTRFMVAANGGISMGGNVGQPAFDLQLSAGGNFGGTAGKPGGGSWSVSSDRRLKQDVAELDGSLDRLLALRGVTYEYIDPALTNELPGTHTGMIAQEVQQVFPDWVAEAPDGYLRLTFRGFEALTVEALRDLREEKDAEIETLREELASLRRLVEASGMLASPR